MGELQYRTYLGKKPGGLVRVLYFASEQDFDVFLEPITDQIMKLFPDVAFYYSKDPADITDEVLDSVRLAVCPVTLSFLHDDCAQRKAIFYRVQEKHIALLPILEEPDIASVFSAVCGKIQYLNAVKHDETALSFEHKLVAFLDDILLDEKISDRIRDAFDAYIFLSYRKKDRQYANRIMRLIHNNEFMRDVAIWYDEYLVPGENYNDAIGDAILKSKLVTLVVTPNLVNEDNYIRRTEYPMVREQGKAVLPIQAVDTDREALKNGYEALPDPVDVNREDEVTEALLRQFQVEGMKENDDPDHLFFIALAYLYGIDVETDTERAVKLLTRSSEGGCLEASRRLVNIYLEGRYVEADYLKAAVVQQRMVAQTEERKESWQREDYLEIIDYERNLAKILFDCDQNVKAGEVIRQAYGHVMEMKKRFPDEWEEVLRAKVLIQYAEVLRNANIPEAEQPQMNKLIMDVYEDICGTYMELFEREEVYDPDWDILPMLRPMTEVSGEDNFMLGLYADEGLGAMYFASLRGKERNEDGTFDRRFLALSYSFSKLICDFCEVSVQTLPHLKKRDALRQVDHLKEYEPTVKTGSVLLLQNGWTGEGLEIGERYYRAFGQMYRILGEYEKAKEMLEMAFALLVQREERPDYLFTQVENCRLLIELAEEMGKGRKKDKEIRYAYFALSEYLEKLANATGSEVFRKQLEENEAEIERRGLEPVD